MKRAVLWLLFCALGLGLVAGALVVSRREQTLRDDEVNQQRLMFYELLPGRSLSVPVDADVDAIRVVAHAFKRGSAAPTPGVALLRARQRAATGERTERLRLEVTGKATEARSEDGELGPGERTTLNLDTSDSSPGLLSLTLDELPGADGLLVRFYARKALAKPEARSRRVGLSLHERQRLARRAGTLDWVDLDADARAALLAVRWVKVAALPDSEQALVSHVLTLQVPNQTGPKPPQQAPAPSAVGAAAGATERRTLLDFTRIAPLHPAVVEADAAPLLLRLSARLPLEPGAEPGRLQLLARIEAPHAAARTFELQQDARATSADRYRVGGVIADGSTALPSERAVFHVLVPAHGRVTLEPTSGVVDLSLAELDPLAAPRRARTLDADPEPWLGFVTRRPSNFAAFPPANRGSLLLVPRASTEAATLGFDPALERAHVPRPAAAAILERDERSYVSASSLSVEVPPAGVVLPLRLFSSDEVEVAVVIDDGLPRRRVVGTPRFVTTSHGLHFRGDAALSVMLGDDLEPGTHRVSLRYDHAVKVWLHAPWRGHSRELLESTWISGDLEP